MSAQDETVRVPEQAEAARQATIEALLARRREIDARLDALQRAGPDAGPTTDRPGDQPSVSPTAPTILGPRDAAPGTDPASTVQLIGTLVGEILPSDADAGGDPLEAVEGAIERRYEDLGELGRGGMGVVRVTLDRVLRRRVAMKLIQQSAASADLAEAFVEEAQITGQLDHPNIVPVHDFGVASSTDVYFTMKLVEGSTLEAAISDLHANGFDDVRLDGILRVMLKVCEAISFAHSRGVVHRDLKPANVMIGTHGQVYVMDWGLGLVLASQHKATGGEQEGPTEAPRQVTTSSPGRGLTSSLAGTVSNMAPEQAQGRVDAVDQRTDVFAIGTILYQVLTGRPPYVGEMSRALEQARAARIEPPGAVVERPLPPALCEITMRALQRESADRYQAVEDIRRDLEIFLVGGGWFATRDYGRGEVIVREGDRGDEAYVIIHGRCEVSQGQAEDRRVLRVLEPGYVFGETALLGDSRRTATVTALDDVTIKLITARAFDRELERSCLVRAIVKQLTARFLELERKRPHESD